MTDDDIRRARALTSRIDVYLQLGETVDNSAKLLRYAADTIADLLAERETFYLDYRTKCDEQTKALHVERDALARDTARFDWYFSQTDKIDFMQTYMTGMREGWTPDQWRAAIDAAMKGASDDR